MNRVLGILVIVVAAAGCGGGETVDRPAVVPAEGVVTYQGKPVEGATIVVAPETTDPENPGASAITDADGYFVLSTFPPDPGIIPGRYKVGISKTEIPVTATPEQHDLPRSATTPKYIISQKYNNPATSGQALDLPAGGRTDLKYELK